MKYRQLSSNSDYAAKSHDFIVCTKSFKIKSVAGLNRKKI